jgi:DNA invertase Pin-like site-specific DNA recombinase
MDKASGKLAKRPELGKCLAYLREADVLVITRLSQAMRLLRHLLELSHELDQRGIGLKVLKQGIDTATPHGRLVFSHPCAVDEFQRELIVEGANEGLAAARARGRQSGRPRKLDEAQVTLTRELYDGGRYTVADIASLVKVSWGTVYANEALPGASSAA